MKIIHTSDIHLDSPLTTRLSAIESRARRNEITETFRKIIDEAVKINAEAIIISGDLFDTERANMKTVATILEAIEAAESVSFFYLSGNHEKNLLISSGQKMPQNLFVFGEEWTYFKIGGVTVAGRSKISADMFGSLTLNEDETNILVLHGILADKSDDGEKIGKRELEKLPVDYLALGHYHSFSETKVSSRSTAVYSGTPEGRGFDEAGDKGYVLLDIEGGEVNYEFKKIAKRTLHIKEVDISSAVREIDIEDFVGEAIADISALDLVRVVLVGEHASSLSRDTDALEKRFSERYFYFEAQDKSKIRISPDEYKNDKSLKGEFIRLVMSKEELSDDMRAAIIECGIRALAGEL